MHLLQFEPQLPATDKFYSGFRSIYLQKAHPRGRDACAGKENKNCLLVLLLRSERRIWPSLAYDGKMLGVQTSKPHYPRGVFQQLSLSFLIKPFFIFVSGLCFSLDVV